MHVKIGTDCIQLQAGSGPLRWMPDAVQRFHERRDSTDNVPVAGDSPEDYMSPIVRLLVTCGKAGRSMDHCRESLLFSVVCRRSFNRSEM